MQTNDSSSFNAVKVRVRRTQQQNGEVPFFFASVLGLDGVAAEAEATAALRNRIGGFKAPPSGENLPILPISMLEPTWDALMLGETTDDDWSYDQNDGTVRSGGDDIPEAVLYPQSTGSPGNFGTVNIGPSSN